MVSAQFSGKIACFAIAGCNATTWISSIIVIDITGYFLRDYPRDQHLTYEMVIVRIESKILTGSHAYSRIVVINRPWPLDPLIRPFRVIEPQVLLCVAQFHFQLSLVDCIRVCCARLQ